MQRFFAMMTDVKTLAIFFGQENNIPADIKNQ